MLGKRERANLISMYRRAEKMVRETGYNAVMTRAESGPDCAYSRCACNYDDACNQLRDLADMLNEGASSSYSEAADKFIQSSWSPYRTEEKQ